LDSPNLVGFVLPETAVWSFLRAQPRRSVLEADERMWWRRDGNERPPAHNAQKMKDRRATVLPKFDQTF
jgi:hypothetical protein